MKVTITADQQVRLAKTVEMSEADFAEYNRLIDDTEMRGRELDEAIKKIAAKYGFDGGSDDQIDWQDMDEVTFEQEKETP